MLKNLEVGVLRLTMRTMLVKALKGGSRMLHVEEIGSLLFHVIRAFLYTPSMLGLMFSFRKL